MPRHVHAEMLAAQQKPTLKVFHRAGMVTNFEALEAGIRKFVGVTMCAERDSDGKPTGDHGKFMTTDLAEELPQRKEYLMAIAEGHLAAMDEDTARRAGAYGRVPWKSLLATEEEKKIASDAAQALLESDKANVVAAEKRKIALAPENPVPDASKLGSVKSDAVLLKRAADAQAEADARTAARKAAGTPDSPPADAPASPPAPAK